MNKLTALMITALLALTATVWAGVKNVAVVETEVDVASGAEKALNKAEVRTITSVLRKEAVKHLSQQKYNIMTSETVMAQGGAVLEECADENCVITLGSKIGADYIVRGTVSRFGAKLTVSVDIYETEDGNLVASSDLVKSDKIEELLELTATACANMYKAFEQARDQTARRGTAGQQTQTQEPQQSSAQGAAAPTATVTQKAVADASGVITDSRDGKKYRTVVIGGKRWMAENLNYKSKWGNSWCYFDKKTNADYCDKYGRLYDWSTARGVCMAGWHLPSREEWGDLAKAAGGIGEYGQKGPAGNKLKAKSVWWKIGTDEYGFSALPGGYRYYYSDGVFQAAGLHGGWWTATEHGSSYAYVRVMYYHKDYVIESDGGKGDGYSVRCIQD